MTPRDARVRPASPEQPASPEARPHGRGPAGWLRHPLGIDGCWCGHMVAPAIAQPFQPLRRFWRSDVIALNRWVQHVRGWRRGGDGGAATSVRRSVPRAHAHPARGAPGFPAARACWLLSCPGGAPAGHPPITVSVDRAVRGRGMQVRARTSAPSLRVVLPIGRSRTPPLILLSERVQRSSPACRSSWDRTQGGKAGAAALRVPRPVGNTAANSTVRGGRARCFCDAVREAGIVYRMPRAARPVAARPVRRARSYTGKKRHT